MRVALIITVFFLALTASTFAITYTDCGSVDGKLMNVTVSPCPEEPNPCRLKVGTYVTVTITFVPTLNSSTLTAQAFSMIPGFQPEQFPLDQPDACQSGPQCPLVAGQVQHYKDTNYVDPSLPQLKMTIKWELKDEFVKDMVCFETLVEIITD